MYGLCFNLADANLNWESSVYWTVTLSNNTVVHQDDGFLNTWIRLGDYLRDNPSLRIKRYDVHFRDNIYSLPKNQSGYYFAQGIIQGVGRANGLNYYSMGYVESPTTVQIQCIKTPELICMTKENRPLAQCSSPMLILNPPT